MVKLEKPCISKKVGPVGDINLPFQSSNFGPIFML